MSIANSQLVELNKLAWGAEPIGTNVFQRWCQGFTFSSAEPSALVQNNGGPCAVIASVQSGILRYLLFTREQPLKDVANSTLFSPMDSSDVLVKAILDIMVLVSCTSSTNTWCWVHWIERDSPSHCLSTPESTSTDAQEPTMEHFLQGLKFTSVESLNELHAVILSLAPQLQSQYGVLCFLYSVLLTHGVDKLRQGMSDDQSDTLIDPVHGHASQCLINLLISGRCTPHLFDGECSVSGIVLTGIPEQPKTGFLTLFEALRYCESGWYLKNPLFPVWILGSETHFTVLASPESQLVCEEQSDGRSTTLHQAELEFGKLSPDQDANSGFIGSDRLDELLERLKITVPQNSITELRRKLDPEELGIILEGPFLEHFFPSEIAKRRTVVRNFQLIHYNGLGKSNPDGQVRYVIGEAQLLDPVDDPADSEPIDNSPIHRCLRTKWPTIRIKWPDGRIPSLN